MSRKGIVLVNLGTPDKPEKKEVKSYLREFLMDKNVIDIPYFSRLLLVRGIILNTRPKKSAEAYRKIWTDRGSPLLFHSEDLLKKVQSRVENPVELAMRYNKPSIKTAINNLIAKDCDEILFFPLYPQYAMSTTLTVQEKVETEIKKIGNPIPFSFVPPFYNDEDYIGLLSGSIKDELNKVDYDHILFSYHGVPVRQIEKTDPTGLHCYKVENCCEIDSPAHEFCYRHQSFVISKKVADKLGLNHDQYSSSFQSRLGKTEWIQPYTEDTLVNLAKKGVKKLLVVTPSFVADCLETIEEIGMEGKATFKDNGGEEYGLVSCLNSSSEWADLISKWVR